MKPRTVAIFGAGIAGLTLAAALRARGTDCRVYEKRSQDDGGGMGFILSAQALADLDEAGVPWRGEMPGTALHRFHRYDPSGCLRHVEGMPAGWRGVRRADVIAALGDLLPTTMVAYGAGLATLGLEGRGRVKDAILTTGERIEADLYVAADGSRSRARRALFPWWPERQAPVQELVGVVHDGRMRAWVGEAFHKFCARGIAVGVLPVGGDTIVWFVQFEAPSSPSPTCTRSIRTPNGLCVRLQERARVALVPGTARWFGPGAAGHVRLSFATSHAVLREAFDRLDPVVAELVS